MSIELSQKQTIIYNGQAPAQVFWHGSGFLPHLPIWRPKRSETWRFWDTIETQSTEKDVEWYVICMCMILIIPVSVWFYWISLPSFLWTLTLTMVVSWAWQPQGPATSRAALITSCVRAIKQKQRERVWWHLVQSRYPPHHEPHIDEAAKDIWK